MKLKNFAIVVIAVSFEPSMKEINEYLKMKLKKQWRTTTVNSTLLLLEMKGMVMVILTSNRRTMISTLQKKFGRNAKAKLYDFFSVEDK